MIKLQLEDIIIKILYQLLIIKNVRNVDNLTLKKCISILDKSLELNAIELLVLDDEHCLENSEYFYIESNKYILNDDITIERLLSKLQNIPEEVDMIFKSYSLLECLGVNKYDIKCSDGILFQILEKTRDFYYKVADCLTPKEYEYLKKQLKYKQCCNCAILNCKIRRSGIACESWDNKQFVGKSKVLSEINIRNM